MTRHVPFSAWIGLAVIAISEAAMLAKIEPFWSWHTPIAWTGYILLVDGLVWRRRGSSLLRDNRAEAVFIAIVGVPMWVIFEFYNKYTLHNWYYIGLPEVLLVRYAGYAWAFATISLGLIETAELVGSVRDRRAPPYRRAGPHRVPLGIRGWASVIAGAVLLLIPIVHPSTWLAAPVWLGFIFVLDPLNAAAGAESIRGDLVDGHRGRVVNLLASGLICGFLWELWNFWARAKWIYNVPVPPHVKIFEMPVAGFAGFPPFAVECFVMYVFVRQWIWRGAWRPIAL
ncbi:MAG: hypothetical protein DMF84_20960 [Acidobacteria bacterium]|nr:MAG: hypothetical protein DMF84_20960 [Acidobacteriota bacterium]